MSFKIGIDSNDNFNIGFSSEDGFNTSLNSDHKIDVNFIPTPPLKIDFENDSDLTLNFGEIQEGRIDAAKWSEIMEKPFERIGETLTVRDGTLDVNIHEVHNDAGGLTTIIG